MALSEEARLARNRYARELRQRRKETAQGRKQLENVAELYWLRKAAKYREQDEAAAAARKAGN